MAYRDDDATDALEAPTADGKLRVTLAASRVALEVGERALQIAERHATVVDGKKRRSLAIDGRLAIARGFPREDFGVWIELVFDDRSRKSDKSRAMRRVFGVEPAPLLEPDGLAALRKLEAVAQRVRGALGAGRAVEIGSGHVLDRVLVLDEGDRYELFARRLFRGAAEHVLSVHTDGRIVAPGVGEAEVRSRFGVTVRGDYVRFADPHGTDLLKVAIPWIGPEDRDELARRIGQLVDRP